MKSVIFASLLLLGTGAGAQNRFVYENYQTQPNTIAGFQISSDGNLNQLANSPFTTGGNGDYGPMESMAIVQTSAGPVLYAANAGDPSISAFTINTTSGDLTPIAGSPFAVSNDSAGTWDVAASPNNHFLFATNGFGTVIHVYAIALSTGALSEVAGSPFQAGANIRGLYVTANNQFLLAAGNSNNAVEVFSIATSGAIAQVPGSPFAANSSVSDVRSNCLSNRVFTADNGSAFIDAYQMSENGSLTPVPGSPFYNGTSGSGSNSFDLAIAPTGKFLFTTDSFSGDITSFAVAPSGKLSQAPNSPSGPGGWLGGTAITAAGDYLYSVDFANGSVSADAIHPDGSLSFVGRSGGGGISPNGEPNSVISYPAPACATTTAK